MPDVVSIENVSKIYRLGEINRAQLFGDIRRWFQRKVGVGQGFGNPVGEVGEGGASDVFWALKDVSLTIRQGETLAIIGANGAGKSTLLKIISRITAPTEGTVRICGRVGSLLEVGTGFHPDLSGRDNVYLNGAIHGMRRSEVKKKFDAIVSFAGIERFIDSPVKHYSSGMYVRLAFSVASFLEPEILIVDEVLSVGDQKFQDKCMGRITDLINEGRTLIFVSHGAETVARLCSRTVYLKEGKVAFDGDTMSAVEEYYLDQYIDLKTLDKTRDLMRQSIDSKAP